MKDMSVKELIVKCGVGWNDFKAELLRRFEELEKYNTKLLKDTRKIIGRSKNINKIFKVWEIVMRRLSDDEIAKIGSETRLRELPNMLVDEDDWNNIEPALLTFARKIIKETLRRRNADTRVMKKGRQPIRQKEKETGR